MNDNLVSRVKRLVAGSVNGLVDSVESAAPETVMREAIREVDGAITDLRETLGTTIANRHHANKRLMDANAKHEELTEKANFAISQNRDDLAEAALANQLDMEAQMPVLEATLRDLTSEQSELEGYISALLARKREMESELKTFLDTREATSVSNDDASKPADAKTAKAGAVADKAETAFDRALEGASGVGAAGRTDAGTAAKLAELDTIAREHRVQERLAALKARKD